MLKIENISKTFNRGTVNEKRALRELSLHLKPGDYVTVIGSNGAGKSTLFNAICGTFLLDEGIITLDGQDITLQKEHRRALNIGRVFQDPMKGTAPHMTIEENLSLAYSRATAKPLSFAPSRKQVALFKERIAEFGMGLEDRLKTRVGLLSGGQRQAAALLMATIAEPQLLLLDEHTAALDPGTAEKVLALTQRLVAEKHLTCLMITHNMQDALNLGNRTIMMGGGEILYDLSGPAREKATVASLIRLFSDASGQTTASDRMLLGLELEDEERDDPDDAVPEENEPKKKKKHSKKHQKQA
jgi:putative ABC transport system ATP-binding protein